MYEFTANEWRQFTTIERKMIILGRDYISYDLPTKQFHQKMRLMLNWPMPTMKYKRTYDAQWSRLMTKMRHINESRARTSVSDTISP